MRIPMNIHPYCNCHATGKFLQQDGYSLDVASGLWIHPRCGKPSQMNYEREVLGLTQIPQRKVEEDYVVLERQREALLIIQEELGWKPEDDDDDEYE